MIVTVVGVGKQWVLADIAITLPICMTLVLDTTIMGFALEKIAPGVVPENAIGDFGICATVSRDAKLVLRYC